MIKHILITLAIVQIIASARTPGGFSSDCVYGVESGSSVYQQKSGYVVYSNSGITTLENCNARKKPEHGIAWKTWAQYQNLALVDYLSGQWTVPSIPTDISDQILYFWNGVEPTDNSEVIQPVLQFGYAPSGGGNYWAVACWYVNSEGTAIFSPLVDAQPGDTILGEMYNIGNGTWFMQGTNLNTMNKTSLYYTPLEPSNITYAYEVLEAYSISDCDQYPQTGVVKFSDIEVKVNGNSVTPQWQVEHKNPTCGETVDVLDPTDVNIVFSP